MRDTLRAIVVAGFAAAASHLCHAGDAPYFPSYKHGEKTNGLPHSYAGWYAGSLKLMGEPALWPAKTNTEVYRFLILPTWGHPIAVRAIVTNGAAKIISRRLSRTGGYALGKLAEQSESILSRDDSIELRKRIDGLKFFVMSTEDDILGNDGERWMLEGAANGKYHVIHRWSASSFDPDERGLKPFLHLCEFLVTKSGLSMRPMNKGHELLNK